MCSPRTGVDLMCLLKLRMVVALADNQNDTASQFKECKFIFIGKRQKSETALNSKESLDKIFTQTKTQQKTQNSAFKNFLQSGEHGRNKNVVKLLKQPKKTLSKMDYVMQLYQPIS